MGIIRRDETDHINCLGEDGIEYTVVEFTEIHDATEFGGSAQEEGMKYFRLRSGTTVNRIGGSEFEVLATGLKLNRIE